MIEIIESEFIKAAIDTAGAELKSIHHKQKNKEYLWQGSADFWPRRAPVLFPIVGKLNGNSYLSGSKKYSLPQHGFARDRSFSVEKKSKSRITFILNSDSESLKTYPFDFELRITYELHNNTLKVMYDLINVNEGEMYFSIGAHPGFNCPVNAGEKFSDYYIEFEKEETAGRCLLDEGVFNGKTEPLLKSSKFLDLNYELFRKDAVVFKNLRSNYLFLKSKTSGYELKFEFEGFPYFGIWTKDNAPFICLEPWCGLADNNDFTGELKDKEGIISLAKSEHFNRSYMITI